MSSESKKDPLDISLSTRRSLQIKEARDRGLRSEYEIELYLADKDLDQNLITFEEWNKRWDEINIRHTGDPCRPGPLSGVIVVLLLLGGAGLIVWFFVYSILSQLGIV